MSDEQNNTSESNSVNEEEPVNKQVTKVTEPTDSEPNKTSEPVGKETRLTDEQQQSREKHQSVTSSNKVTESEHEEAAGTTKSGNKTETKTESAVTEDETANQKAQAKAAAKASAAKAKPKRAAKKKEEQKPLEPSPNQPVLDRYVAKIKAELGEDAVEDAVINRPNGHLPTIRIKRDKWLETAELLKTDPELGFNYLKDLTAYDDDDFMAVVVHLYAFSTKASLAVHVRTERDPAWVPSVTSVWSAANWNEREVYDLFGIVFKGHPNLTRIMMPDSWEGHPLRKDYVPLDEEV